MKGFQPFIQSKAQFMITYLTMWNSWQFQLPKTINMTSETKSEPS